MVCTHLRELYELCEKNQLRLGGSDLIRIVCKQCNQEETCPSVLIDEYESAHREDQPPSVSQQSPVGVEPTT
jgi:hypothetical protein